MGYFFSCDYVTTSIRDILTKKVPLLTLKDNHLTIRRPMILFSPILTT